MVLSDLPAVNQTGTILGVWKSALGRYGELFVMTTGLRSMPMWLADSLASQDSVSSIVLVSQGNCNIHACGRGAKVHRPIGSFKQSSIFN